MGTEMSVGLCRRYSEDGWSSSSVEKVIFPVRGSVIVERRRDVALSQKSRSSRPRFEEGMERWSIKLEHNAGCLSRSGLSTVHVIVGLK